MMRYQLAAFLLFIVTAAWGQVPQSTIRVEVKTDAGPVRDADVTANGHTMKTGADGIAVLPATLGKTDINVAKDGFFPAHATLSVEQSQQAEVEIELQPKEAAEEEVTVYATPHQRAASGLPVACGSGQPG